MTDLAQRQPSAAPTGTAAPPDPAVAIGVGHRAAPGRPPAGAEGRPTWERPALAALLVATAALYLWGLGAGGWANSFYSAAAQAGSVSWKAWFFGSSDAANSITVDKPPASLWVMGLSVRLFGLDTWSLLVPQALMGVGTVAVVHASVRRRFSAQAALLAGAVMATTPVAALMFRFNNPDALLTLLMALAALTTLVGIEDGRRRWVVATGVLLGFAFLTKQLQMMLVVPPLALAHLVASPHRLGRRLTDLVVAGASLVAGAGWWLAIVELWPAGSRPYIGGSQTNSILELTLGYNGLGRLTGDEVGSVGGGGPGGAGTGVAGAGIAGGGNGGRWGETGITRMVDGVIGGQIAWLLPAALIGLVAGLWLTRRAPRTDARRAALIVWGGWLVVTALVFSFMAGIFHEYYTVALAPAIAALVGMGADLLWRNRHHLAARLALAGTVALSTWWAVELLARAPDWNPWLRPLVAVTGALGALLLAGAGHLPGRAVAGRLLTGGAILAIAAVLIGPAAWAAETVANPETGSIVTAGPAVEGGRAGGPGGFTGPGGQGGPGRLPGGAAGPGGPAGPGGAAGGGIGGLLDSAEVGDEIVALLQQDAADHTWAAAAVGSNRASGYQLASEEPVMPIGGFNGSDPYPTLEQFQAHVADGDIHWFIAGGGFGNQMGGSGEASVIAAWVEANFDAVIVDEVTLYDLTG